jgi:hypothetical protein
MLQNFVFEIAAAQCRRRGTVTAMLNALLTPGGPITKQTLHVDWLKFAILQNCVKRTAKSQNLFINEFSLYTTQKFYFFQ